MDYTSYILILVENKREAIKTYYVDYRNAVWLKKAFPNDGLRWIVGKVADDTLCYLREGIFALEESAWENTFQPHGSEERTRDLLVKLLTGAALYNTARWHIEELDH